MTRINRALYDRSVKHEPVAEFVARKLCIAFVALTALLVLAQQGGS